MAWIHPFIDGNGRACRLQTHCALWSVSRGLARRRDEYYERLDAGDGPRQGYLDGRGNLGEKELRRWREWFIGICEDQVSFMARMFYLDGMKTRVQALISFRAAHDKRIRFDAALPLYHPFLAGPTARGEFQQMTGFGERTARTLLSHLIETGFVTSTGHVVPVRFAFPLDALHFCCPSFTRKRLVAKTEHGRGHAPAVGYRREVLRKSEPDHFCLIRLAICIRNLRITWQ